MPSSEVVRYAREWVADCEWVEDAEELAELSDTAVVAGAARHYCGGLAALERDARA